jgi:hypothetical protein
MISDQEQFGDSPGPGVAEDEIGSGEAVATVDGRTVWYSMAQQCDWPAQSVDFPDVASAVLASWREQFALSKFLSRQEWREWGDMKDTDTIVD